jgi:GNAT superfamily N-acetyltransferase
MPEFRVRRLRAEEHESLRDLRLEALRTNPTAFGANLAEAEAQPPEHWIDRARVGATSESDIVFVAEEAGCLIGMTGVHVPTNPKSSHSGMVWGVFVKPQGRKRGIGEALVRAAIDWSRSQGLHILKLAASIHGDDSAKKCYERCGFILYGTEPMAIRYDGRTYDELLMALQLK